MEREFKGVWIPKEIWLDERLTALDKIILAEVDSLDNEDTGCYASNEYIAQFCKCSASKVSQSISKLIKLEYLYQQSFDGRKRVLKSRLLNFSRKANKIYKADYEKIEEINIDNNKAINIDYKKEIEEVISYLNNKLGSNYRATAKVHITPIKQRLDEKYTVEQLKKVIDIKYNDWHNTEFAKHLVPKTLFGNKFDIYLNQKTKGSDIEETYNLDELRKRAENKTDYDF